MFIWQPLVFATVHVKLLYMTWEYHYIILYIYIVISYMHVKLWKGWCFKKVVKDSKVKTEKAGCLYSCECWPCLQRRPALLHTLMKRELTGDVKFGRRLGKTHISMPLAGFKAGKKCKRISNNRYFAIFSWYIEEYHRHFIIISSINGEKRATFLAYRDMSDIWRNIER